MPAEFFFMSSFDLINVERDIKQPIIIIIHVLNFLQLKMVQRYVKCLIISNTKVSDKMMANANSADPDQTAPQGAV